MKVLFAIVLLFSTAQAEITLVREGHPQAAIIVPDHIAKITHMPTSKLTKESVSVSLAAVEMADYLEKISGTRPTILAESKAAAHNGPRIFIGACQATLEVVKDVPKPEEFVIRTQGGNLHIFGGDLAPGDLACCGTLYGVYDFMEQELGVHWLFPGEHGEVVPKRNSIVIGDIDRSFQPPIQKRKVRNVAVSREETFKPVLERWDVPMDAWQAAQGPEATGAWFVRQRLGSRSEIEGGHAYSGWYEKYAAEHPEWFALQPDGTRRQKLPRERLCKSNPALWDEIARVRVAEFKADPKLRMASLAPNDGSSNKFCMCEDCRALDPAEAPKVLNDAQLIDPATGKPFAEYPSLSDRVFTFFNEIAKRVRVDVPDRDLVCYAYSVYRTPPVRVKQLEPNLIVGFVGLDPIAIEAWSKIAPRLYIRPNDLGPAIDLGMPRNQAAYFANAVKFSVGHKAIGFDFDNCHGNWSSHGLDYYVLCKALWNPALDVHATVADYCRAAYGPGAAAMLHFHKRLTQISDAARADPALGPRKPNAARLGRHYNAEALTALENDLAAARAAVTDGDPGILARLQMAADGLHYAKLVTSLLEVAHDKQSPLYQQRLASVEAHLKTQVLKPGLAPLHAHRYLRMALSYAEREVE